MTTSLLTIVALLVSRLQCLERKMIIIIIIRILVIFIIIITTIMIITILANLHQKRENPSSNSTKNRVNAH